MSLHIQAGKGDIAEGILLPGDPLRAKAIAEYFLSDVVCFNKMRGMLGFTGMWKGTRVSVMGTGMGMPSASIYIHELIQSYDVKRLIRVGTAGAIRQEIPLRALVMALGACSDSGLNRQRFHGNDFSAIPDFNLAMRAKKIAQIQNLNLIAGNILSSDFFYQDHLKESMALWASYGVLGVEMETAELYTLAAKFNVSALAIMTISDHIPTGTSVPPAERQHDVKTIAELALDLLLPENENA